MLKNIKGIGPKNLELLNKLNIKTIDDLINYYPFRYNFYQKTELKNGPVCVSGIVESPAIATYIKKNLNKLTFRLQIENYLVNVSLFNRAFMKNNIIRGKTVTVIGEYDEKKNSITCQDIKFRDLENEYIEPVYHSTHSLSSKVLNNLITTALSTNPEIIDYIPNYLKEEYEFINKDTALKIIHNPESTKNIKNATLRLKYEELFKFMFKINYLKINNEKVEGLIRNIDNDQMNSFISNLPFKLTDDQLKSAHEIYEDLTTSKRMNRLLLGDVGSGKTIVGIIAMYINFLGGYQSAMLAPTEILATQHFYNMKKLLKDYDIHIELLKGGMSKLERKKIIENLKAGEIDILIGTHAVLEKDVEFMNLGLVITDEQHRFGVNQRSAFQNKGTLCDVLYMSATPIPRTYALTIYGDMDISLIKTKPSGRKEIQTSLVKFKEIKTVLSEMLEELKRNHQIYVVCPMIDTDEEKDLTDVKKIKEKISTAFQNKVPIAMLHGKLKSKEKEQIMEDFKSGKTKILISTTVIEVGVDVPNATMMVIFNAERFGLATIHQLRGRIGRNSLESKCIMISDKESERLKVLTESTDGFYISEMDFKLRGEGDLFGVRQSGDMVFTIANLKDDMKILTQANIDSAKFIKENIENNFVNHPHFLTIIEELKHLD